MAVKRRRRKRRFNSRFYYFLAAVAVIILVPIILVITLHKEDVMTLGSGRFELSAKSAIVRDEVCVTGEKYEKIVFHAKEGAQVSVGDVIAQVFKLGYNEDMLQSLLSVQDRILTEQLSAVRGVEDAEFSAIDEQILQKEQEIRKCIMKEADASSKDLLTLERELRAMLLQRETYLAEKVHANEALTSLYTDEERQSALIKEWSNDIVAGATGTVSFYFDGYEQVLCASKMDMINADLINSVLKGASVKTSSDSMDTFLYRIGNQNHWYLAFVTSASNVTRLAGGERYTVVCEGYSDRPYTGIALEPVISGNHVLNVLEFHDDIGALANVRTVSIEIKQTFDGIEVPSEAVSIENGVAGIKVLVGNETRRVEVVVLADDGTYAIIRAKNSGEALNVGQRFERK